MILGCVALAASSLLGGLSQNVIAYILAAMILGVYFAFSSGTVDSVVYDTVVEHTGSNELYETWSGRTRAVESAAVALSALAGGVLAQYTSTRLTYFATVPLVGLAVIGFLRFEEPRLHQAAERVSLRRHVALTFRTMITSRVVLCVLLLVAAGGLLSQAVFEFGPLWLVEVEAPAVVYGPYWAVLVSTLGVAGLLIGKLDLDRRLLLAVLIILSLVTALLLTWTRSLPLLISAQVVLALVLAIISIHASRLLHDAVPSSVRAGVSSGGGTLTWTLFLPFSLLFGWVAAENGINWSGFMLAGAAVVLAVLLVISVHASRGVTPVQVAATAKQEAVEVTQAAEQLACKQLVELVADYLDDALAPEIRARFEEHLTGCDGCTTYLKQTQQIISELRGLTTERDDVQAPRRQSTDY
jgi:MFS family permease